MYKYYIYNHNEYIGIFRLPDGVDDDHICEYYTIDRGSEYYLQWHESWWTKGHLMRDHKELVKEISEEEAFLEMI